jgi:hypothetical protein
MAAKKTRSIIGWREWVGLPLLGVAAVKAKIDTGARTSAIHAFDVETSEADGITWVDFSIHPLQNNDEVVVQTRAEVLEFREIRSSSGETSLRPVILTKMRLYGKLRKLELTLANRDQMGFRMLLGRQALRKRFLVDPENSYLLSNDR